MCYNYATVLVFPPHFIFYSVDIRICSWYYVILQTTLHTDDMDLAGDIIQSLATYLGIEVSE